MTDSTVGFVQPLMPALLGIASFRRAPLAAIADLPPASVVIAGAPFESPDADQWGSRFAPRTMRETSVRDASYLARAVEHAVIELDSGAKASASATAHVFDVGDLTVYPTSTTKTFDALRDSMRQIAERAAISVVLGGGDWITAPLVAGLALARGSGTPARVGLLRLSSTLWRGSDSWAAGSPSLPAEPHQVACVGARGLVSETQLVEAKERGVGIFSRHDVRVRGTVAVLADALDLVSRDVDALYVSLGLDVMDFAFAPATDRVGIGGLSALEFLACASKLAQAPIDALDVVGVCPRLDPAAITERLAVSAVTTCLRTHLLDVTPTPERLAEDL